MEYRSIVSKLKTLTYHQLRWATKSLDPTIPDTIPLQIKAKRLANSFFFFFLLTDDQYDVRPLGPLSAAPIQVAGSLRQCPVHHERPTISIALIDSLEPNRPANIHLRHYQIQSSIINKLLHSETAHSISKKKFKFKKKKHSKFKKNSKN